MSKIKSILPEGIDITDPRDPGVYPGEEEAEQEREISTGWAIFELQKAAAFLTNNAGHLTVGDLQDISKSVLKLQTIPSRVNKVEVPF